MNPNDYSTYLAKVDYKVAGQTHHVEFELSAQNAAIAEEEATTFVENADVNRGAWEADCGIYDVKLAGEADDRQVESVSITFVCVLEQE